MSADKKPYHTKASGQALATVKKRSKPHELKLYGSCFCPFVQRVWISLELKGVDYEYVEIDPYEKTADFLAINPRGLIPALRDGEWSCYESTVLMEYLEEKRYGQPAGAGAGADAHTTNPRPLLPADAKRRAHARLWADHVNRKVVPAFYHVLRAQTADEQAEEAAQLRDALERLVDAADPAGPFFAGDAIGFVDVQLAPWLLRLRRVLRPYRGWPAPRDGSRWKAWVDAVEADAAVRATTSDDGLYLDSYERYAENRPGTSQVQEAVNKGRGLP